MWEITASLHIWVSLYSFFSFPFCLYFHIQYIPKSIGKWLLGCKSCLSDFWRYCFLLALNVVEEKMPFLLHRWFFIYFAVSAYQSRSLLIVCPWWWSPKYHHVGNSQCQWCQWCWHPQKLFWFSFKIVFNFKIEYPYFFPHDGVEILAFQHFML